MKVLLILAGPAKVKPKEMVQPGYPIMAPPLTLPLLATVLRQEGHEVELNSEAQSTQ